MEELWDIYKEDGTFSGKTIKASDELPDGAWIRLVHFFIFNSEGRVLLQKRSMKKRWFPGIWDGTGGRVQSGESLREAAVRELYEELGLKAEERDFVPLGIMKTPWRNFIHFYCIRLDFCEDECTVQEDEVDEVRLMSQSEAREIFIRKGEEEYLSLYEKACGIMNEEKK